MACMRAAPIIALALTIGLAGGYAWSAMSSATPDTPASAKAKLSLPSSPEEQPLGSDEEWAARAKEDGATVAASSKSADPTVSYSGCNEVRAAGKAPLHAGDPGYRIEMDGDGDGVACEPHRAP